MMSRRRTRPHPQKEMEKKEGQINGQIGSVECEQSPPPPVLLPDNRIMSSAVSIGRSSHKPSQTCVERTRSTVVSSLSRTKHINALWHVPFFSWVSKSGLLTSRRTSCRSQSVWGSVTGQSREPSTVNVHVGKSYGQRTEGTLHQIMPPHPRGYPVNFVYFFPFLSTSAPRVVALGWEGSWSAHGRGLSLARSVYPVYSPLSATPQESLFLFFF